MADDIPPEVVQPIYNAVIACLDNQSANIQAAVIANVLATFAAETFAQTGTEPFEVIRHVRQNARKMVADRLKQMSVMPRPPKGAVN